MKGRKKASGKMKGGEIQGAGSGTGSEASYGMPKGPATMLAGAEKSGARIGSKRRKG